MENPDPPSPQIKDGKMARFCPSRGFILDLGGGGGGVGGLLFHFILSKIVGELVNALDPRYANASLDFFP